MFALINIRGFLVRQMYLATLRFPGALTLLVRQLCSRLELFRTPERPDAYLETF